MAQRAGVRVVPISITGVAHAMPPFALAPLFKVSEQSQFATVCVLCCAMLCCVLGVGWAMGNTAGVRLTVVLCSTRYS